jgi:hypothetical protein
MLCLAPVCGQNSTINALRVNMAQKKAAEAMPLRLSLS